VLHKPLVVSEVAGPRSKMQERNAESIDQHRWPSSVLVPGASWFTA
jgi:hypothetical protein